MHSTHTRTHAYFGQLSLRISSSFVGVESSFLLAPAHVAMPSHPVLLTMAMRTRHHIRFCVGDIARAPRRSRIVSENVCMSYECESRRTIRRVFALHTHTSYAICTCAYLCVRVVECFVCNLLLGRSFTFSLKRNLSLQH